MTRPGQPPGADLWDGDLAAVHNAVDYLGVGLAVWSYRREPDDAHARSCAADAIGAIDAALAALYRIRGQFVTEVRRADDEAAVRVDELLAKRRDGPRETEGRQRPTPAAPNAEAMPSQATPGRRPGRERREAAP